MTIVQSPDPFAEVCQRCDATIGKGETCYTVVLDNKQAFICQTCYDALIKDKMISESDPEIIYSVNK